MNEEDGGCNQHAAETIVEYDNLIEIFQMDEQKATVADTEEPFSNQFIDTLDIDSNVTIDDLEFHLSNHVSDITITTQSRAVP